MSSYTIRSSAPELGTTFERRTASLQGHARNPKEEGSPREVGLGRSGAALVQRSGRRRHRHAVRLPPAVVPADGQQLHRDPVRQSRHPRPIGLLGNAQNDRRCDLGGSAVVIDWADRVWGDRLFAVSDRPISMRHVGKARLSSRIPASVIWFDHVKLSDWRVLSDWRCFIPASVIWRTAERLSERRRGNPLKRAKPASVMLANVKSSDPSCVKPVRCNSPASVRPMPCRFSDWSFVNPSMFSKPASVTFVNVRSSDWSLVAPLRVFKPASVTLALERFSDSSSASP